MRIRIGKRQMDGASAAQVSTAIQELILKDVAEDVLRVSAPRLRRMAAQLQAAGEAQAQAIMPTIGRAIGKMQGGVSSRDLKAGGDNPLGVAAGGTITWQPLSLRYAIWKQKLSAERRKRVDSRVATTPNSHFILTGSLERWFLNAPRNFGGVKVKVTTAGLAERRTTTIRRSELGGAGANGPMKLFLGRFTISVLPRLETHLMPGLASRRWTDVGGSHGEFERATFGARIGNKLVGGDHVPYRPLVLPIIQYFALVRIPAALRAQIKRSAQTLLEGATNE